MSFVFPGSSANSYSWGIFPPSIEDHRVGASAQVHQGVTSRMEVLLIRRQLEQFRSLGEDWDGYGAAAIHPETLANASNALEHLAIVLPFAEIDPNPNGTISFEWESKLGLAYLELGRTKFSFFIKPEQGAPIYADGKAIYIDPALGQMVSERLFPMQTITSPVSDIQYDSPGLPNTYRYS